MNLKQIFKRVNELTGKYPNLNKEELEELKVLANDLSVDCLVILSKDFPI